MTTVYYRGRLSYSLPKSFSWTNRRAEPGGFFSWSFVSFLPEKNISFSWPASNGWHLGVYWHCSGGQNQEAGWATWNMRGSEEIPHYYFGHGGLDDRKRLVNHVSQIRGFQTWYSKGNDWYNFWKKFTGKKKKKYCQAFQQLSLAPLLHLLFPATFSHTFTPLAFSTCLLCPLFFIIIVIVTSFYAATTTKVTNFIKLNEAQLVPQPV